MPAFLRLTECYDGSCPAVDLNLETGNFKVTGYKLAAEHKVGLPDTEDSVELPPQVITALINRLLQQGLRSLPQVP